MEKHAPHLCYHCSCTIHPDVPEKRVPGLKSYQIRYMHETEEGCQKALQKMGIFSAKLVDDDPEELYNGRE